MKDKPSGEGYLHQPREGTSKQHLQVFISFIVVHKNRIMNPLKSKRDLQNYQKEMMVRSTYSEAPPGNEAQKY